MSPVDSIRPPKRAKKTPAAANPPVQVKSAVKISATDITESIPEKPKKTAPQTPTEQKHKTVIITVMVIMAVIFIAWVALFMSGNLTRSQTSNFGIKLSDTLRNLWENIKTDILKIKNLNQNTNISNINEEQIRNLENSVFPQFNDPTKQ